MAFVIANEKYLVDRLLVMLCLPMPGIFIMSKPFLVSRAAEIEMLTVNTH